MRDYDELVKRLRELPHLLFVQLHGHEDVVYQAADAIEELIAQQRGNEEGVKVIQMEIDRLLASRTPKEET